ncbi:hypothetical protein AX17_005968 [Amanita inopinata Kibby_2008]|nr:hypothetical protein AX17_005968 [Amanita inopinata Kibby_2008]
MPPTATNNHDPALTHPAPNQTAPQPSQPSTGVPGSMQPAELTNVPLAGLDQTQIMNLLRHLPQVFNKLTEQGKEDAAQTLSNLAQAPFAGQPQHQSPNQPPPPPPQQQPGHPLAYPGVTGLPGINDPGPSSHPRGPPNLGQLSAVAMQAAPAPLVPGQLPPHPHPPPQQPHPHPMQHEEAADEDEAIRSARAAAGGKDGAAGSPSATSATSPTTGTGGRRGGRSAAMGTDEWTRQRKDNHKEVERRRRGNINEGINELGRIVPNGNGEKAKGAILSRAVQYIHHLKENEARNIEKWTLEKLLMDQAMGDLQAQLEEMKRLWEEERMARQRAENEIELLRSMHGIAAANANANASAPNQSQISGPSASKSLMEGGEVMSGNKRRNENGEPCVVTEGAESERDGKRQRTE